MRCDLTNFLCRASRAELRLPGLKGQWSGSGAHLRVQCAHPRTQAGNCSELPSARTCWRVCSEETQLGQYQHAPLHTLHLWVQPVQRDFHGSTLPLGCASAAQDVCNGHLKAHPASSRTCLRGHLQIEQGTSECSLELDRPDGEELTPCEVTKTEMRRGPCLVSACPW